MIVLDFGMLLAAYCSVVKVADEVWQGWLRTSIFLINRWFLPFLPGAP
jgi:hypothetical protein